MSKQKETRSQQASEVWDDKLPVIEIKNLVKSFGAQEVLKNATLNLQGGPASEARPWREAPEPHVLGWRLQPAYNTS